MKTKTEDVLKKDVLTEKDINLLKNRANRGEVIEFDLDNREYEITPEQTRKGLDFLNNLRRTPTGKERKNNPFGAREEEALDTFVCFKFDGLHDAGNQWVKFYVPIYTVCGKDTVFTYYYTRGGINIIG